VGGFLVDLDALQQAADGVTDTLTDVQNKNVGDIGQDAAAFGHDRLAETIGDFCTRWQLGVQHLSTDAQEISSRLSDCVLAYRQLDQAVGDHFAGILQRMDGPDPAAQ
jgi:hypothetical protein